MKGLLIFLFLAASGSVLASAPLTTMKNATFYHFKLGSFQVTTISDGYLTQKPTQQLSNIKPEKTLELLHKNFLSEEVEGSINTFLINTGSKIVLVDSGAGSIMGDHAGHMLENLKAAGYTPDEVDAVVITHIHPDHLGGVSTAGKINFPKATLYIDKRDVDFLSEPKTLASLPDQMKAFFEYAINAYTPYKNAGKLNAFSGKTEIVPGVSTRDCYGHTPGHTCYEVKSGEETLVLIGDSLHVAAVQFEVPTAGMMFDKDPKAATANRQRVLKDASTAKEWIGGAHISFPGTGHVRKEKVGYSYIPGNYQHE